jgi:hypothetical protein
MVHCPTVPYPTPLNFALLLSAVPYLPPPYPMLHPLLSPPQHYLPLPLPPLHYTPNLIRHTYLLQQTYWHVYASMITTALVVYFSLPAAVTAGAFRREVAGGQLDSLSTLPGKCQQGCRVGKKRCKGRGRGRKGKIRDDGGRGHHTSDVG